LDLRGIAMSEILGPIADTDGSIDIEIRDLDQNGNRQSRHTISIRLGLSLADGRPRARTCPA